MASRTTIAALLSVASVAAAGCGGSTSKPKGQAQLRDPAPAGQVLAATPAEGKQRPVSQSSGRGSKAARRGGARKTRRPAQPSQKQRGARKRHGYTRALGGPVQSASPDKAVIRGPITNADAARVKAVENVVRELAAAVSSGDSSACTRLMTQRYVESITGLRGAAAVTKCRVDMSHSHGHVVVTRIDGVRLAGSSAVIQFATTANGESGGKQILQLVEAGGSWLIDQALRAAN
jgi:hypothetical protein